MKKGQIIDVKATDVEGGKASTEDGAMMEMHYQAALANERRVQLAKDLGYTGALTIGGLEDEIRFWQNRTVEALLELGKRLLLLKEITPHGEFAQRVQMLGIAQRTAQRFMQAAFKTAKSANLALLSGQVKNQSAFLELITEDDDTLEKLAEMDAVDRMGPSELRKALRDARAEVQAKETVLGVKAEAIEKLQEQVARIRHEKPDETGAELLKAFAGAVADAQGAVTGTLRNGVVEVLKHYVTNGGKDPSLHVAGALAAVQAEINAIRAEFNLPDLAGAEVPAWLVDGDGTDGAQTSAAAG